MASSKKARSIQIYIYQLYSASSIVIIAKALARFRRDSVKTASFALHALYTAILGYLYARPALSGACSDGSLVAWRAGHTYLDGITARRL